jgi:hypothetical protein
MERDADVRPRQRKVAGTPSKVQIMIVCYVTRRLVGLEMAQAHFEESEQVSEWVRELPAPQPAGTL